LPSGRRRGRAGHRRRDVDDARSTDGLARQPLHSPKSDADVVLLEVERDADDAVLELEPLQRDAFEAGRARCRRRPEDGATSERSV
jgi:hypothetical protein